MKTLSLFIFFAILLLPLQIFSQIDNKYELDPYRLLQERVNSITKPDERIKQRLQIDNFSNSESRAIINKKILDNGFLLIEVIFQGNSVYSGWMNIAKTTFTYDVNNNMIEKIHFDWESYYWSSDGRWTYTYDVNNNMIEEIYQDIIFGNWENSWRSAFTYDMNNYMIEELYHVWNGSNWTIALKYSYVYDINYNLINELKQSWNGSNWVNSTQTTFTYDVNNNLIEELHQDWGGNNWVNYFKSTYIYNLNNYKIEGLLQDWDGSNWINLIKLAFTYDANNNMIENVHQKWENSTWINYRKYTSTYNINNILTQVIYQAWWATVWVNDTRWIYTYDANNNKIEELTQDWSGYGYWLDQDRVIYSYIPIITDVNAITGEALTYTLSNNFPNPFNPSTTIKYSIPQTSQVQIKIFDVLGNEIGTFINEEKPAGTYENTWNAENLPSGVYFYQLKAGVYLSTKKMILIR